MTFPSPRTLVSNSLDSAFALWPFPVSEYFWSCVFSSEVALNVKQQTYKLNNEWESGGCQRRDAHDQRFAWKPAAQVWGISIRERYRRERADGVLQRLEGVQDRLSGQKREVLQAAPLDWNRTRAVRTVLSGEVGPTQGFSTSISFVREERMN